jgi:hypothetical protein
MMPCGKPDTFLKKSLRQDPLPVEFPLVVRFGAKSLFGKVHTPLPAVSL